MPAPARNLGSPCSLQPHSSASPHCSRPSTSSSSKPSQSSTDLPSSIGHPARGQGRRTELDDLGRRMRPRFDARLANGGAGLAGQHGVEWTTIGRVSAWPRQRRESRSVEANPIRAQLGRQDILTYSKRLCVVRTALSQCKTERISKGVRPGRRAERVLCKTLCESPRRGPTVLTGFRKREGCRGRPVRRADQPGGRSERNRPRASVHRRARSTIAD